MNPIRRFFYASAGAACLLLAAGASAQTQVLIDQALKAMGGEAAVDALKTVSIRGSNQQREYESSFEPGAKAELRPAGHDPLLAKLRPGEAEVVNGLRKWNLNAENFAGGHGSVGPVAPLMKLAGN